MGGGSKQPDTTTQKTEPWSGVQPYLTDYLKLGQNVTKNPFQFYNGDTVAGFAPEQELGMNFATQRALAGSPTQNAANQQVTSTLRGDYLNPSSNPYLQATADRALGDVQTRVNSQFNNSNFGGSAHQETLQRGLGEQANAIYGQNYTNERNNQMGAVNSAIPLAAADYADASVLQGVGQQRQNLANQYLGLNQSTFDQAAQFPYEQLARYGNVVSQGTGAGSTTTATGPAQQSNKLGGAIGGATLGYSIGSGLSAGGAAAGAAKGSTFGPWGAAIGGIGGLLLS
jgi:hypothetical protein